MIKWIDMVDPVYTLARLAGIDPDENQITGINITQHRLIIYYNTKDGASEYVSKPYEL